MQSGGRSVLVGLLVASAAACGEDYGPYPQPSEPESFLGRSCDGETTIVARDERRLSFLSVASNTFTSEDIRRGELTDAGWEESVRLDVEYPDPVDGCVSDDKCLNVADLDAGTTFWCVPNTPDSHAELAEFSRLVMTGLSNCEANEFVEPEEDCVPLP